MLLILIYPLSLQQAEWVRTSEHFTWLAFLGIFTGVLVGNGRTSTRRSVTVRGVTYHDVLVTTETSRLDPGVVESKYYAPNVGFVLGVTAKGGDERTELVSIGTCSK